MIKKLILLIYLFLYLVNPVKAQEVFKVTSVNFDTSNSVIFLTSPDNTSEPILKNIKLTKLSNPSRVYFDINSAILTTQPQNWYLSSNEIKQFKIAQFSTDPLVLRIVLYVDDSFDTSKISYERINNNIAIKLKNIGISDNYFHTSYTDEHVSSSKYYENLSISDNEACKVNIQSNNNPDKKVLTQIQEAFDKSMAPKCSIKDIPSNIQANTKKIMLKSKYHLGTALTKNGVILLSGFGDLAFEKPIYLSEPKRVVFDIPNATVNPDYANKTIKFSESEHYKIGQFQKNKVRVVIYSENPQKFYPIISTDGQSSIITKSNNFDYTVLFSRKSDAVNYYYKSINKNTDEFIISFNSPVVHSVKRTDNGVFIRFFNVYRYNIDTFNNYIASTPLNKMKLELLPKVGIELQLPLEKENTVETFLGADSKSLKILVKGPKACIQIPMAITSCPVIKKKNKYTVTIDPGHGGSDYGAIRSGINEKDINLDISKRVQSILQSKGINALMTRDKDDFVSLEDRTIFNKNTESDIFVSIHVNSSVKPDISGIETHYYHPHSVTLAETVHSYIAKSIKTTDRGLFKSKFYVINHSDVPSILIEIGFISNDAERAELVSEKRKQATANAIADGIIKYLKK